MLKVFNRFQLAPAADFSARRDARRKCQVCGNTFVPTTAGSRSCEFCRSPFHNLVSLAHAGAAADAR